MNKAIPLLNLGNGCHGLGVFDKAVLAGKTQCRSHGLTEDGKTVTPHFEKSVGSGRMRKICSSLVGLWLMLAAVAGSAVTLHAADSPGSDAKAALKKHSFPWYDAQHDGFRSLRPKKPDRIKPAEGIEVPSVGLPFIQIILWIVLGVIVALLVTAAAQWLMNAVPSPEAEKSAPVVTVSLERLEALPESTRHVRDLLGEAARLAAQGEYGQAMTFFHGWQLTQLDKQGLLELQKGKTNRQYHAEVNQSKPTLLELFRQSTRLFEDAFFGHMEVSREQFEQVWNQRGSFEATLRRGQP